MVNRLLPPLLFLCTLYPASAAATTVRGPSPTFGDPVQAAQQFVMSHLGTFGVDKAQLSLTQLMPVPRGVVVRFSQTVDGLPAIGAGVTVLIQRGRIVVATGKLFAISRLAGKPTVSKARALETVYHAKEGIKVSAAHLAVATSRTPGQPVWVINAVTHKPVNSWRILVDARSAKLIHGISTLRHAEEEALHSATGYAYLPNPVVGQVEKVTLSRLKSTDRLVGVFASVGRCGSNEEKLECSSLAVPSHGDGASYDYQPREPTIDDAFAEVHTYYHVDTFTHWLTERFGFARKDGQPINVFVNFHYTQGERAYGMANAFFGDIDGDNKGDLVFGQANRDFSYDADVIYHEYTHSVIDQTSGLEPDFDDLGLNAMPLALNEAFADLISSAFTGDAQVGEYAGGSYGNMAIRDLEGSSLQCPKDLSGESHHDGQIWGRLVWRIRKQAEDLRRFDELMYTTMVTLQRSSSFADAAAVLEAIIVDNGDSKLADAAERELGKANVGETCQRIVDLAALGQHQGYSLGTSAVMGLPYVPAGLQYKIEVPEDAIAMKLELETLAGRNTSQLFGSFIRKGSPVSFAGREPLRDITQDSATPKLSIDNASDHQLEPGATYYLLPLNISQYALGYRVSVAFELRKQDVVADAGPMVEPDSTLPLQEGNAGIPPVQDPEHRVRGCQLGASAPTSLLALTLLALFTFRRRRNTR